MTLNPIENERPIRLLIAEDHEVVRWGLVTVLSLEPDIMVCGEARDGRTAVELARTCQPNLCLLDYKMPFMTGVAAGQAIREFLPTCKILILTGVDADVTIFEALENGVDGYVLKEATPEELLKAIRTVAEGNAYLHPIVTRKVLSRLAKNSPKTTPNLLPKGEESALSEREREVLKAIALGQTNREIADYLVVSEETIRSHIKNIFRKLGVNDRTQAAIIGLKYKLIQE